MARANRAATFTTAEALFCLPNTDVVVMSKLKSIPLVWVLLARWNTLYSIDDKTNPRENVY